MRVLFLGRDGRVPLVVRMMEATWEGRLPFDAYTLAGLEGPGRVHGFEPPSILEPSRPQIQVLVDMDDAWILEVLDSKGGFHLQAVQVVTTAREAPADPQYVFLTHRDRVPTAAQGGVVLASEASSPIRLPTSEESGFYWVHAEGYLPRAIERHGFLRKVSVRLERSGTLEIAVAPLRQVDSAGTSSGLEDALEFRVEVPHDPQAVWKGSLESGRTYRRDVAAGTCQIEVRRVPEIGMGAVLWSRVVSIPPEEVVRVELDLEEVLPLSVAADLTLMVYLNREDERLRGEKLNAWMRAGPGLPWTSVGQVSCGPWMESTDGMLSEKHVLGLQPGEYLFQLNAVRLRASALVLPGKNELFLDGSELGDVRVLVRGAGPGEDLVLYWNAIEDARGLGAGKVAVDANGQADIRCGAGPIWVQALGPHGASPRTQIEVIGGQTARVTLDVSPEHLSRVRVSLWQGGAHAFAPSSLWRSVRVEPLGHAGREVKKSFGIHGTSVRIARDTYTPNWSQVVLEVSPPGRYRLLLDEPNAAGWPKFELDFDAPIGVGELMVLLP